MQLTLKKTSLCHQGRDLTLRILMQRCSEMEIYQHYNGSSTSSEKHSIIHIGVHIHSLYTTALLSDQSFYPYLSPNLQSILVFPFKLTSLYLYISLYLQFNLPLSSPDLHPFPWQTVSFCAVVLVSHHHLPFISFDHESPLQKTIVLAFLPYF